MGRLQDRRILVTAAGAGIGRACAEAFAREGAAVLATDVDADALAALQAASAGIEVRRLDVSSERQISDLAAERSDLDAVVNVAGWVHHGTVLDCSREDWERSIGLNLTSVFLVAQAFLPAMCERGKGNILNISSVASSIIGVPNRAAYGATKAGVIGLTKAIAVDFVSRGVRCNVICPGTIDTPSLHGRIRAQGDVDTVMQGFIARQPMRRLGRAEEVAALAVHLVSDESAFTTGAVHVIDGGWTSL